MNKWLLCAVVWLCSSPGAHAATVVGNIWSAPTVLDEGQTGVFHYLASISTDTPADTVRNARLGWDFGDGSTRTTYSSHVGLTFSERVYYYYDDEGTYTVSVEGTRDADLYEYHTDPDGVSQWIIHESVGLPQDTHQVTINNVAPSLMSITDDQHVGRSENFVFSAAASDPGRFDVLTYLWDLDNDGRYDDYAGESGTYNFAYSGIHEIMVQVDDGDGGYDYGSFQVQVVPLPAAFWMLGSALLGLGIVSRGRPR